jgi:hypothetical protein
MSQERAAELTKVRDELQTKFADAMKSINQKIASEQSSEEDNYKAVGQAARDLAMAGDAARAESLTQDLGKRFPMDTLMHSIWLPTIHARIALARDNASTALNRLQAAVPMELGQVAFVANISCLYPVYVHGEAYWQRDRARLPPPSSRKFSTTPASSGTAGPEPWRIWAWLAPMPCRRELRKEPTPMLPASGHSPPTRIS